MNSKQRTNRSYNKAACNVCYPPEKETKKRDQFDVPLDKAHLRTTKHKFITTVGMDQIDLLKLRPQENQFDKFSVQREEFDRRNKLNNKKPWLDVRYCKKNKDYIYFCNYCGSFILGGTVYKHEQLDSHWQNFQTQFMSDLNNLLLKNDLKLEKSVLEFTQKYTGTKLENAKEFFTTRTNKAITRDLTDVGINKVNDSGIGVSITNASFDCDKSMITSTPIKTGRKIVPPKKVQKETIYVKDMHTSMDVRKIGHKETIRMYYQNVNSVKSDEKMKNFLAASIVDRYDIVIFTETWLEEGQPLKYNMEVFNEYFDVYRCDRSGSPKSRGGGALIAISAKLYSDPVLLKECDHLEYVCVQFFNNNKSIFLYCAYIPPESTLEIYKDHIRAIRSIKLSKNDNLIVVGDFNLPNIVWRTKDNVTFAPENNDSIRETRLQTQKIALLKELQSECGLYQFCNAKNSKGNVLDLVFSNGIDHISIETLSESQKPMSKPDERHAPPFDIVYKTNKSLPFLCAMKTFGA